MTISNDRRPTKAQLRGGDVLRRSMKSKGQKRRSDLADIKASGSGRSRNDLLPKLELVHINPIELKVPARNVRGVDSVQVRRIMNSITNVGFVAPVLIDQDNNILNGVSTCRSRKFRPRGLGYMRWNRRLLHRDACPASPALFSCLRPVQVAAAA